MFVARRTRKGVSVEAMDRGFWNGLLIALFGRRCAKCARYVRVEGRVEGQQRRLKGSCSC